jgi:hypothetical protein
MSTYQIQCPHCSGFRVTSIQKTCNSRTGKQVKPIGIFGLFILLCLGPGLIYAGIANVFRSFSPLGIDPVTTFIGVIFTTIMVLRIVVYNKNSKGTYILTYYHCELCGKDWAVRQGDAQPPLENQINPSLAALGAKKLEEEEAERKKREQEAAAAYYLSQNK